MNIRSKFFKIIIITFLMMILVTIIYYSFLILPIKKISKEQFLIEQFKFRLVSFQTEMNRMNLTTLNVQSQRNKKEIKLLNDAYKNVPKISYIRNLNYEIKDALDSISERKEFLDDINNDIILQYNEIKNEAINVIGSDSVSFSQIDSNYYNIADESSLYLIKFNIMQLNRKMFTLNNIIDDSIQILDGQMNIINNKLTNIKSTNFIITLVIISFFLINIFAFSMILPNSIAKKISMIEKSITFLTLNNGQLTIKMHLQNNEQVLKIKKDLNSFMNYLILSFNEIKDFLKKNKDINDNTTIDNDPLNIMNQSIDVINEEANLLIDNVKVSSKTLTDIILRIKSFYNKIEITESIDKQSDFTENNNLKRISYDNRELSNSLMKSEDTGLIIIKSSYKRIENIIQNVINLNKIIQFINFITYNNKTLSEDALKYFEKIDDKKIIHFDNIKKSYLRNLKYPVKEKNLLLLSMKLGNINIINDAIAKFALQFKGSTGKKIKILKIRLYELICSLIDTAVEIGVKEELFKNLDMNYFNEIDNLNNVNEIEKWLYKTVNEIISLISNSNKSKAKQILYKAINYIKMNYNKDISVKDAAREIFISPSHFHNLLKKEESFSFIDFLTKTRLQKAKELLLNSDLSITQIAFEVGFNDSNYFSTVFKKNENITPIEFRKKNKFFN